MPKGILHVEPRPSAPHRVHHDCDWHDKVRLPEVLAVEGFISATRLRPLDDGGGRVAPYQIQGNDLRALFENPKKMAGVGTLHLSDALELEPRPTVQPLQFVSEREQLRPKSVELTEE